MIHSSAECFTTHIPPRSRIAELVAEYERWLGVYDQAGVAEGRLGKDADETTKSDLEIAGGQAVRRMAEAADELLLTPARTPYELGLKARVVQELSGELFDHQSGEKLDRRDQLIRSLIVEAMALHDRPRMRRPDLTPHEVLPGFVEPPLLPLAPASTAPLPAPASPCLAGALGRHFGQALASFNTLDRQRSTEGAREGRDMMQEAIEAFQGALPHAAALSPEGALAQLAVACGGATVLSDAIPAANEGDAREWSTRIHLSLWSIRHFLEAQFGVDARDVGSEYHMPTRNDRAGNAAALAAELSGEGASHAQRASA